MKSGEKCLVIGSGISGVGSATLLEHIDAEVVLYDSDEKLTAQDIREKHTGFCTGQRRTDRQTQIFSPRPKSPTENTLSAPVMARTLADWQKLILRKSIGELSNYGQVEAN